MNKPAEKTEASPDATIDMKDIVSLCKRRGFIFQASDIYGGINGFWDYGPLGTELKNNLRDYWWKSMVTTPPIGPDGTPVQIVGLDSAIIQNPDVWVASGHVGGFSDPMVDCKETQKRYRADHLVILIPSDDTPWIATIEDDEDFLKARLKKVGKGKSLSDFTQKNLTDIDFSDFDKILAPDAKTKGTLTEPKEFNLLFETGIGASANDKVTAYLRGETAQGILSLIHI